MLHSHLVATLLTSLAATLGMWSFWELLAIEREVGRMSRTWLAVAAANLALFLECIALLGTLLLPDEKDAIGLVGCVLLLGAAVIVAILRMSRGHMRELRLRAEQLEAGRRALERQAIERREALRHILHELRGPLLPLLGYLDLVRAGRAGWTDDKAVETLDKASRCGERLALLLDRLSTRPQPFELAVVDAAALLRDAIIEVSYAAGHKGLALGLDLPADLPAVRADRDRLLLVFTNLLHNSVKFTPAGGRVSVSATLRADGDGDRPAQVRFEVADTGRGIPAESLDDVFTPGWQVEEADRAMGTGEGLAIVRQILSLHGAHPEIASEIGRGTTVSFALEAARKG